MNTPRLAAALVWTGLLCTPALLSACAGAGVPAAATHDTLTDMDTPLAKADRMLNQGEYESAVAYYDQALEDAPGSLVVREKLATARRMAAQDRAKRAIAAAAEGKADEARGHLKKAEIYDISAPVVRRARAQLDGVLRDAGRATGLKDEARDQVVRHPQRALELLAEARELDANDPEIVSMLREATLRTEAVRAAERAGTAWRDGRRDVAVRELGSARFAGRPVVAAEIVRSEIEGDLLEETLDGADVDTLRRAREISVRIGLAGSVVRTLRQRLGAELQRRSKALLDAGRPAVAALLETECLRLGTAVPTPALDAVAERAKIRIAVAAFIDGTGGEVDGLRLARTLSARLETDARGGGAVLAILHPSPGDDRVLAAHPRALRLTGEVRSARISESPRNTVVRKVKLQEGVRIETNPALAVVLAEIGVLGDRREAVHEKVLDAETTLDRLNAIPFARRATGEFVGEGRASYELSLARAEARLANLRRREKSLVQQEAAARRRASTLPPRRETALFGTYPLETLEFKKVAMVTVRLHMRSGDEILLDADVTGSAHHDEVVAPGLPEVGLAEDPDDTPDDAEMARRAADHFATVAAGRIRESAERAARRFLVDARRAEQSGRKKEAAEAYALYLLSTAEVSSPRRADAARALYELAEVRVPLRTGVGELE